MRLDVLIIFNIHLCLLCLFSAPLISLIRKKLPHIPSPLYSIFLLLTANLLHGFWTETYSTPLFYLPFPIPQFSAAIPAFAVQNSELLEKLWYIYGAGAVITLLILLTSHLLFRWRVNLDRTDCPQHITDIAERVLREKQYQLLLDICKRQNREPKEKELARLQKQKLPRIIISNAVHTPGILPSFRSCIVLDRTDYTDEQLEAIFFYLMSCRYTFLYWYTIFFTAICWFNPLFWFLHRSIHTDNSIITEGHLFSTDEETAERHTPDFYKAKRAAHEKLLDELTTDTSPSRNFFPIASTERVTKRRKHSLKRNTLEFVAVFSFIFILSFEMIMPLIVQPYENPPLTEQSLFSILGVSAEQLHDDIDDTEQFRILSAEKDSRLYGTRYVYGQTDSNAVVRYIMLSYEEAFNRENTKAEWHRIYDTLCERLGESSRPFTENEYLDYIWHTTNTDGEAVQIRMDIRPSSILHSSADSAYVYIYLE